MKIAKGLCVFVCVLCLLCACGSLFAQGDVASVAGRVLDPNGAIIIEATVTAKNVDTGVETITQTNEEGIYRFANLTPGTYEFTVSKHGFKVILKPGVTLHLADAISLNFNMVVGDLNETVRVEAGATTINTTDASISTVVDQTYVKNMPLNGRSFQDLILLAPGVVTQTPQLNPLNGQVGVGQTGEFSVNGQRTESNYYTVDGVSANTGIGGTSFGSNALGWSAASGSVAASTALGTTQGLVSVDDLQEFRVQTSTYSAEYGRNPGAQVVFETKSGVNQFHGTAYDYLRNNYFDANDWFNDYFKVPEPALRQNDFGGTLGGPVLIPGAYNGKNKTFFFVSYEGLRLLQPQAAFPVQVPDDALRASTPAPLNQVLNAFPKQSANGVDDTANGVAQFIGSWSNPSSIDTTSARFDQVVNDKLRLFFRFSNALSNQTALGAFQGSPSQYTSSAFTTRTYTGGASAMFSSRWSDELRLNYTSNANTSSDTIHAFGGSTAVDFAKLAGFGPTGFVNPFFILGGGAYFLSIDQTNDAGTQRQWNLVDTVSYSVGRHQFKFGADYRRLTPLAVPHNPEVFYEFCCDQTAVQSNPPTTTDTLVGALAPGYPLTQNFSLFAEDEWKVTSRLNLSLGLRWEVNPATSTTQGIKPSTIAFVGTPDTWQLAPQGTPLWKTAWYNFAPRLGAAYTLRNAAGWETVVRGGGGVFFDTGQQLGTVSFIGPGFSSSSAAGCLGSTSFPGTPLAVPPIASPSQGPFFAVYGYAPHLQLPYTLQWSAGVEQALGSSQAVTVSYVGSHASRLLQENQFTSAANPLIQGGGRFLVIENGQTSDYDALQAQFQRRLSRGLTALASYTWSHCLDYGSLNYQFGYERGDCIVDVRHNVSGAFSYDLPSVGHNRIANAILDHWGIDDRFLARTAFPVDLTGTSVFDPTTQQRLSNGLDFVPGQPIYVYGAQCAAIFGPSGTGGLQAGQGCPGGRAINPNAFANVATGLGNVPRDFARGFGAWQMNLGVRREFPIYEQLRLQFRAEAFNVFNHPNFGTINAGFGQNNFGLATATLANSLGILSPLYQMGGARSMQLALKVVF
jgi:hypothetical protein